jgi:hypothetical protein
MLPKNSKHYIQPTSEQLGIDPQIVEDVVGFYYTTLRKTLEDLPHPYIVIEHFGAFSIKEKELPQLVAKYVQHLKVLKKETFAQMTIKKNVELKLKKILRLQKMLIAEREAKKEFYKKKKDAKVKSNMESPETNS